MITIQDNDLPITVAQKIVSGTKPYEASAFTKAVVKAITGDGTDADSVDMFSLEEIKEIADYLMVYYLAHEKKGD